jgi:hypothetical protein
MMKFCFLISFSFKNRAIELPAASAAHITLLRDDAYNITEGCIPNCG